MCVEVQDCARCSCQYQLDHLRMAGSVMQGQLAAVIGRQGSLGGSLQQRLQNWHMPFSSRQVQRGEALVRGCCSKLGRGLQQQLHSLQAAPLSC